MFDIAPQTLGYLAAAMALLGLMAYVCLAGADFGGGVWDLLASGVRKRQQRDAIAHAMGPVWEANHVWMIFVLVVQFTCFPRGYAALMESLFIPLHLVLAGIMLRGAAFVFRNYGPGPEHRLRASMARLFPRAITHYSAWGVVFGVASVISPLLMGWSFGVVTAGQVRADSAGFFAVRGGWFHAYPIGCALLALVTCAYIAAVYLIHETSGELREDFRRRAILAGTATAACAFAVLAAARVEAVWLFDQLTAPRTLPVLAAGGVAFAMSAIAVFRRWIDAARIFAVAQTLLMLLGWGLAHRDYLIYPDVTLMWAMAPVPTVQFMLVAIVLGTLILIPSLMLMFRVFKTPGAQSGSRNRKRVVKPRWGSDGCD